MGQDYFIQLSSLCRTTPTEITCKYNHKLRYPAAYTFDCLDDKFKIKNTKRKATDEAEERVYKKRK
jgi:hypothetical protein